MRPYSEDLRWRVVRAVTLGTPREEVARQFAVSVPTITRWLRLKRETGGLAPKPVPGPPASKLDAVMAALPARLAERADATLAEQCSWWRGVSGLAVSTATMSRALTRLGMTRKKVPEGARTQRGGPGRLARGRRPRPARGPGLPRRDRQPPRLHPDPSLGAARRARERDR